MTESSASASTAVWTAPACPFKIEYSLRAFDDIRLAVMDAFFSLPRGGAEIGGILLGSWEKGRLSITDYVALDCEHAFGPSFQLSRNDELRLQQLLNAKYPAGRVVGWYHSHTRSEIFLSQADLEIQRKFFPEPWQVAAVLKPHTFHPMRLGFFFRGSDGNIRSEASDREDTLMPLPMKTVTGEAELNPEMLLDAPPAPLNEERKAPENSLLTAASLAAAKQLGIAGEAEAVNGSVVHEPDETTATEPVESRPEAARSFAAPTFGVSRSEERVGLWPWAFALAAFVAICWAGFATREGWWPKVTAMLDHPAAPPQLNLNLIDRDGQLQIHWNAQSPAIAGAAGGVLRISGAGPFPDEISLDKAHLLNGYFTFQRRSERVDVALVVPQSTGQPAAEITTFMGKLPENKPVYLEDPAAKKQREDLTHQVDEMQSRLVNEEIRNRQLQNSIEQLRNQLRIQTQKRMNNQDK